MDEHYTIREALITAMLLSERVDETNAIAVHRTIVRLAALGGIDLDALGDDLEVTEMAEKFLEVALHL